MDLKQDVYLTFAMTTQLRGSSLTFGCKIQRCSTPSRDSPAFSITRDEPTFSTSQTVHRRQTPCRLSAHRVTLRVAVEDGLRVPRRDRTQV